MWIAALIVVLANGLVFTDYESVIELTGRDSREACHQFLQDWETGNGIASNPAVDHFKTGCNFVEL